MSSAVNPPGRYSVTASAVGGADAVTKYLARGSPPSPNHHGSLFRSVGHGGWRVYDCLTRDPLRSAAITTPSVEELEDRSRGVQGTRCAFKPMNAHGESRIVRSVECLLHEAGIAKPRPYGRRQVRCSPRPGPDHGGALRTQLGQGGNRLLHVGVGDVAEDPSHEHQIGRNRPDVRRELPSVCLPDHEVREPSLARCGLGGGHVARVVLKQGPVDPTGIRLCGEDTDEVMALPRACAHHGQPLVGTLVEPRGDVLLHQPQSTRQRGVLISVGFMPRLPVSLVGHPAHHVRARSAPTPRRGPAGLGAAPPAIPESLSRRSALHRAASVFPRPGRRAVRTNPPASGGPGSIAPASGGARQEARPVLRRGIGVDRHWLASRP
ncbi:hypothetical protein GA0074696_1877 [Micromonospora purpureochromogenes]|uniref:Uncharacterized protein n=1 Tax=Micromonospora purpureochromogenes TaxID=47872 RepID=A0A1C4WHA6_9ACTN|nr:hypothetical protein GA0074696_1877 [Micromonospora purpureochromogenes]